MIKKVLLCCLFIISISLYAVDFFVGADTYTGTYYYPQRSEKKLNYRERHCLFFGLQSNSSKHLSFSLGLGIDNPVNNQEVKLDSLIVRYKDIAFVSKEISDGEKNAYFDKDVSDFQRKMLRNYRLTGLTYRKLIGKNLVWKSYLGGNHYNTVIAKQELRWGNENLSAKAYYFYAGRDNLYNKTEHSPGFEAKLKTTAVNFNHYQSYQFLESTNKKENYMTYNELLFNLSHLLIRNNHQNSFRIGSSCFYSQNYRGFNDWFEAVLLLNKRYRQLEGTGYYLKKQNRKFSTESIHSILEYAVKDHFIIGLNGSVTLPKKDYTIGFQLSLYEEFGL